MVKPLSNSKEAIRKRAARAEGRANSRKLADPYAIRERQPAVLPWQRPQRSTYSVLTADKEGRAALRDVGSERGLSSQAIRERFEAFDKLGGFSGPVRMPGNDAIEAGRGWWPTFDPAILIVMIRAALDEVSMRQRIAEMHAADKTQAAKIKMALGITKPKAKRKALARTKEAIRKRKARAEGRVKPRPSRAKPPRTAAQQLAAAVKGVTTREGRLVVLREAAQAGKLPAHQLARAESSLLLARNTAETWRRVVAAEAKQDS